MILGLDISTSVTGITILDNDGKIYYNGYCELKKEKDFFDKTEKLKNEIYDITAKNNINTFDSIFVEESLQAFRAGYSSAATISKLTKFNGVIQWIVYKKYSVKPDVIAAPRARKLAGIAIKKNGIKAKEQVMKFVLDKCPWFGVEYTKTGKIKPHCYDMADSYIVALAGYNTLCSKSLQS